MTMERKIGEIFEYNGEWYQCVEGNCAYCSIQDEACEQRIINDVCRLNRIFKKLEKVGEPYVAYGKVRQKYKLYIPLTITKGIIERDISCDDVHVIVDIENKQNKETMEDMEEKKLNLKPFDLQKAKQGKPVCTRDGRKARIICFDRISGDDVYKIVACVTAFDGDFEEVLSYRIDGYIVDSQNPKDEDLMMLPEKKEGWVNLYKSSVRSTKEEAMKYRNKCNDYIDTIKIEWEE